MRLAERIEGAHFLSPDDRAWMRERLAESQHRYGQIPRGRPIGVVSPASGASGVRARGLGGAGCHETAGGAPWKVSHPP
nr:hypothetical protein GCM10020241_35280 [Streptoalloteichus tenebrarius]